MAKIEFSHSLCNSQLYNSQCRLLPNTSNQGGVQAALAVKLVYIDKCSAYDVGVLL